MTMTDRFVASEWADVYDSPNLKPGYYTFRRARTLALELCIQNSKQGEFWIETGCGTGHFTSDLAAAGLHMIGLDHDLEMIRFARDRFRILCIAAKAEKIPLINKCADGVVAVSVAGCLQGLQPFLGEIHRVLKPEGHAVLTFTNRQSHLHRLNRLFRKSNCCFRAYSADEVILALQGAGFEIKKLRYYNFQLDLGNGISSVMRISQWCEAVTPKRIASRFARNLIVLATARKVSR